MKAGHNSLCEAHIHFKLGCCIHIYVLSCNFLLKQISEEATGGVKQQIYDFCCYKLQESVIPSEINGCASLFYTSMYLT